MDRALDIAHLEQAERHVAQGKWHIARQREVVAVLRVGGFDTRLAVDLLHTFEQIQATHVADRNRIQAELSKD